MPKTIVFVKNAFGDTFTLRLANMDPKEAYLSSCEADGIAWWTFPESSKVLLDGKEKYISEGGVKVRYINQKDKCESLSNFERIIIPLRSATVYTYSVNLHIFYSSTYVGAILETPEGNFHGKVTGLWTD